MLTATETNCVFCGSENAENLIVFPSTFTAYQFLQAGNKACPRCAEMFKDPKYRRNSWIIRKGKFKAIKNVPDFLLNLPSPPFFLYLTKLKRKHGWIRAVQSASDYCCNCKRLIPRSNINPNYAAQRLESEKSVSTELLQRKNKRNTSEEVSVSYMPNMREDLLCTENTESLQSEVCGAITEKNTKFGISTRREESELERGKIQTSKGICLGEMRESPTCNERVCSGTQTYNGKSFGAVSDGRRTSSPCKWDKKRQSARKFDINTSEEPQRRSNMPSLPEKISDSITCPFCGSTNRQKVNVLSTKRFILIVDEDKIMFDDKVYADLYAFARNLYARRIPKSVMLGGMPQPSAHRKYGLTWKESFRLRELQHDPVWRIVVEFKRRD